MPKPDTRVTIIRIDPNARTIARLVIKGKILIHPIQRIVKAKTLGHRKLLQIGGVPLLAAANAEAPETAGGWRLKGGGEATAGLAVLFGQGPGGHMTDVPVDVEWVRRHIVWLTPAETAEGPGDQA